MPQERGYESQVAPRAPAGLPQASAASFGAGVGQGIAELGGAIHQANLRAYQIERQNTADSEAADFNARFARIREEADKASIDARNNAAPGGAGHSEAMKAWYAKQRATLADTITDDRVRRSAEAQLDEFGGRFAAAEYQWQEGTRVGKVVTDTQATSELAANRARRSHDGKSYAEELSLGRQGIEAMSGVPAEVKQKLIEHHDQTVTVGFLNGIVDTNPGAATALLDSGQFDAILSPQQMEQLRNGAQVEVRRGEATARAAQAHAISAAKDELGAIENNLNAGAGTLADRTAMADRYEAIGDKSKAAEWRGKAAAFGAVQASRDWTVPEMDTRLAALDAKRNGGGLSGAEANEYAGLKDQRAASKSRLDEPGGALLQQQYATGRPITPLDTGNPNSFVARGRDARIAAARYGRGTIEPLTPHDVTALRDTMAGGTSGQLEVLDTLRNFGDARTIAGAARQVAGDGQGAFRIAAMLPRAVARDVLRGGETLKAAPQVWKQADATRNFNQWYGRTLSFVGGDYANDVFAAAKSFYAQRASDGGEHQYNPGQHASAIETVLGKDSNGTGGVAHTSRGIVLVPRGIKPDALLRGFARATPEDYSRASGGRFPRWSDGSKMDRGAFARLLPTMVADGHYGFRGSNGQLIHDDHGDTYVIDAAKLPRQ